MIFQNMFQETLNLTTAKRYVRHWDKGSHHKQYDTWFGKDERGRPATRIFIMLKNGKLFTEKNLKDSANDAIVLTGWSKIEHILAQGDSKGNKYEIVWDKTDIKNPIRTDMCKKIGEELRSGQKGTKIGKILQKIDPTAMKLYTRLRDASSGEMKIDARDVLVVISRNPLDISGMSTDRDWESCTAIRGGGIVPREYRTHAAQWSVKRYIEEGALIAYTIKYNDMKNVAHPIGRKLIIPYENKNGEIYLVRNWKDHGDWDSNADYVVDSWLDEKQGPISEYGRLEIVSDIYNDENEEVIGEDTETIEKFKEIFYNQREFDVDDDENFSFFPDSGDIAIITTAQLKEISQREMDEVRWKIYGGMDCSHEQLNGKISLYNMPQTISGVFDCSDNELHGNLEGLPKGIKGSFNCSDNSIESLRGGPGQTTYSRYGSVSDVDIQDYNCSHNKLLDLIGAPKVVGDFDCSYNLLHDLVSAPIIVDGDFDCSNNPLRSFSGAPQQIRGRFIYTKSPFIKDEDIPVYEHGRLIIKPV